MRCLMYGLACDEQQFNKYIEKNKAPYSTAHYLFERELINNLEEYYHIDHNYILQERNKSIKKSLIRSTTQTISDKTFTKYLGFINLPIINFITLFISTFFRTLFYYFNSKEDFFILSTINYFPVALANLFTSKLLHKKNVIIFTDCSVSYAYDQYKNTSIKGRLITYYTKIITFIENHYDAYILFSEPMNILVNQKNKPSVVMEGFFNSNNLDLDTVQKYPQFIILYAGTILNNIGLDNLIESLNYIDDDIQLWIYGEGDYKKDLIEKAKNDKRILFHDYIDHSELFEIEKKVSLLINVRDPKLSYTKYSFPSKTFEYLASGTPFLSTRLDCYPKEYESYIMFIDNNNPQTIANAIIKIIKMTTAERVNFGLQSKEYVFKQKNSKIQSLKIIKFLNQEVLK